MKTPAEILSMRTIAEQLYQAEKFAEAMALYNDLAETNPYDSELKQQLGYCAAQVGQIEPAIEAMIAAVEMGCKFPWFVQYEIARLYAKSGDKEASLGWLEQALANRWENRPGIIEDEAFADFHTDYHFLRLAGALTEPTIDRDEGWRLDVDHLVSEAQRLHISPEQPAFSDQFLATADSLRNQIPTLTDEAIFVAMQRMVAQLNDGHSLIYPAQLTDELQLTSKARLVKLPVSLYCFSDGLFIIDAVEAAKQHIGSEILQIGLSKVEEIIPKVKDFISTDNAMTAKWLTPLYLIQPAFLQALGATEDVTSVSLTIRDPQNNIHKIALNSYDASIDIFEIFPKLRPSPLGQEPPLYLQNVGTHYWMQVLADLNAIYVQYNQVKDGAEQSIAAFADQLQATLRTTASAALIVDVRHNWGGNSFLNRPLLRTLVHFDTAHLDNRIFVLIGRTTFSACQNFVSALEQLTDAIFVGEPTGSSPNFIGEGTQVRLPYSGIRLSISSRLHYTSFWGDDRAWIAPHVPVELSSADYFANQDPVLEAVRALITTQPQ